MVQDVHAKHHKMIIYHFYQVQGTTPAAADAVVPSLVAAALKQNKRVAISCKSDNHAKRLNEFLWTHDDTSFLPHGLAEGDYASEQPVVVITPEAEDIPNQPHILIALDGVVLAYEGMEKVLDVFDSSSTQTAAARKRWTQCKEHNLEPIYYAQTGNGWQQKG